MAAYDVMVLALHVLGAALYVGGAFSILSNNRALRRSGMPDSERRALIRMLGRAGAPIMASGFLVAALTGIAYWMASGWSTRPLMLAKVATALVAAAALAAHVWLGRREGRNVPLAAASGIATLLSALALVVLGAMLR